MLKNNKGTSLIEASIVILLISVLSVMVFSMLNTAISVHARGRENFKRTSEIYSAIESGVTAEGVTAEFKKDDTTKVSIKMTHEMGDTPLDPIDSNGKYHYGQSEDGVVSLFEFVVEE